MKKFPKQSLEDWVNAFQKLLKINRFAFLARKELKPEANEKGIKEEMREALEAVVMTIAEKSLSTL